MQQQHEDDLLDFRDFEQTLPPSKRWENFTLANDFIFGKVMHDPELCTEMIRRILPDMDIGHIEFVESQKSEQHSVDTRGVRFDVYAKTDNRKIFDCEVQTSDKKDLPKRTRAYHIILGLESLNRETLTKSGMYNEMLDTFVIFICTFDPFNLDRHIYSFCNICEEDKSLKLNDGASTIFLNAEGRKDDVSAELKAFLDFLLGKSSDDPYIKKLDERLRESKQRSDWRKNYMMLLTDKEEFGIEKYDEGREEGIAIGKELGCKNAIDFMKSIGVSNEHLNEFMKLSLNL